MVVRSLILFSVFFLQLMMPLGSSCIAQTAATTPRKAGVSLDFKNVELSDLIKTISKLTDKNFVYDERVRGKVTLISPRRVSLDKVYQVFLAVLNIKGYTVVPSGSVNKIVTIREAKRNNVRTLAMAGQANGGEEYVTRIFQLHNISAADILMPLMSLMPKSGSIVALPQTNTLIISDTSSNIDKLAQILQQLDVPNRNSKLEIITLTYANAEDIAKIVNQIEAPTTTGRRGKPSSMPDAAKVIAYRPTNVLVVMANDDDIKIIRSIVARLDQKPNQTRASIQVYYLENADAETLAKTLNEIITGVKAGTGIAARALGNRARAAVADQQQSLEGVSITADKPTNSLIINSTPEEYDVVRNIIRKLDIKRKQVYVEALILELSMDATEQLGASLQGAVATGGNSLVFGTSNLNTGQATLSDLSSGGLLRKTINGILLGGLFSPIIINGPEGTPITVPALSALINLSKSDSDVNILSAPSLLTSDNEEAEILVGSNVPIITSVLTTAVGASTASNSGLAQNSTVERKDVALVLKITPQITAGNLVRLKVDQEITDLAATNVGNVDQVGPTLTKRLLKNTVLVENGKTIVLGGLISNNVQHKVSKVPVLGDIPLLGWLFKSKTTIKKKTNLLVFITAYIIKNPADLAEVTTKAQKMMNQIHAHHGGVFPVNTQHTEQRLKLTPNGKDNGQE